MQFPGIYRGVKVFWRALWGVGDFSGFFGLIPLGIGGNPSGARQRAALHVIGRNHVGENPEEGPKKSTLQRPLYFPLMVWDIPKDARQLSAPRCASCRALNRSGKRLAVAT